MTDRPRAERRTGMSVLYDRQAGYCRELTRREMAALLSELAALIEIDVMCEGQTPERPARR